MYQLINKIIANDKIRYLIAGGCTTCVNIVLFFSLRTFTDIPRNTCNLISISCAILFAYFCNKLFVFRTKNGSISKTIGEFVTFVSMRIISMAVEILGFSILCDSFRMKEVASKIFIQVIVLVLNYLFSKLFVFRKERRTFKEFIKESYVYLIPFGIVAFLVISVCISLGVKPFGSKSLTIIDSLHQYLPFYSEYRDKLLHEGSLFYTWNLALGSNFMSLSAYYLSSPFNYIFLLFPQIEIPTAVTIISILKLSLTGSTMAYYLSKKDGHTSRNIGIIGISVCYALSTFIIGYNWNFMWLDCFMIFPLIILGFEKLMKTGNPKLYVLSLFYCLYANYYIGFMVCIFLVLWFLAYHHRSIKKFFVGGVRFAFYSLIAGGMSAFLLLPAYQGIMTTASAGTKLPPFKWYGSIYEMFKQQFILTKPITNQVFDGGLNAYCGTFAIIAVFLYLLCGDIKLREKIGKFSLLVILLLSFNNERLNFIWHGMHNQYGIPNRFAFLYIFVLLVIAYEVIRRIGKIHVLQVLTATFFALSFVLLVDMKANGGLSKYVLGLTVALIILYTVIMLLRSVKVYGNRVFAILFSAICSIEILYNASEGFGENGVANISHYDTTKEVASANERIDELAETSDAGFYRSELMKSKVLDEVTWHHMPSVGTFCSTVLGDVTNTMGRLGFYTGANEFLYMGSTPFTNSMFNVRYLLEREGDLNNYAYDYVEEVDGIKIYENPYPLSLGYAVSTDVKDWEANAGLPVANQNSLANAMTGESNFFSSVFTEYVAYSEKSDIKATGSSFSFTPYNEGDVSFMASFFVKAEGDYYINCRGNNIYKIKICVNGSEMGYDRYQGQIFHIGKLKKDDYVTIEYTYRGLQKQQYTATIYTYLFNEEAYQKAYEKLKDNLLMVDDYADGYVHGSIDMPENETLFTTIPYDEGWSVKIDGETAEYYKVAGAFIGVDIEAGEHEVEFLYTPRGLYAGIAISVISTIFLVIGVMNNTNKNRHKKLVKNNNNEIDRNINV